MQKLEADVRKHIRIEHQLKLHIEQVEDRVDELERENLEMQHVIEMFDPIEVKCEELQTEVEYLQGKIETYQSQVTQLENESKIKSAKMEMLDLQVKSLTENVQILESEKQTLIKKVETKVNPYSIFLENQPAVASAKKKVFVLNKGGGGTLNLSGCNSRVSIPHKVDYNTVDSKIRSVQKVPLKKVQIDTKKLLVK